MFQSLPWLREPAPAEQPGQPRRGSLKTTLTAAQRSLRPPEAPGFCGLSKTGAFFLPFPWRDYQLHLSQKLRLNLLSRSRGSRGSSARSVRLSASPGRPSELEMAKVRTELRRGEINQAAKKASRSWEDRCIALGLSALGSCTSATPKNKKLKNFKSSRLR